MIFQPGDIFLTKGDSFVSRAIRWFTRDKGESRTEANHVGIIVGMGSSQTAVVVEALTKVRRRTFKAYRQKSTEVAVFRPTNLSNDEIRQVVERAKGYVGADYGYVKLVAHFIDWCLGGVYLARRIVSMDKYPICSWLVAYSYGAVGKDFGVPNWAASPDDIWDFCMENPDKYRLIHPLGVMQ